MPSNPSTKTNTPDLRSAKTPAGFTSTESAVMVFWEHIVRAAGDISTDEPS